MVHGFHRSCEIEQINVRTVFKLVFFNPNSCVLESATYFREHFISLHHTNKPFSHAVVRPTDLSVPGGLSAAAQIENYVSPPFKMFRGWLASSFPVRSDGEA